MRTNFVQPERDPDIIVPSNEHYHRTAVWVEENFMMSQINDEGHWMICRPPRDIEQWLEHNSYIDEVQTFLAERELLDA